MIYGVGVIGAAVVFYAGYLVGYNRGFVLGGVSAAKLIQRWADDSKRPQR